MGCRAGARVPLRARAALHAVFSSLWTTQVEHYIKATTSITTPRVIYYPDESPIGSWADRVLGLLGYDSDPPKLQTLIRKTFRDATSRIKVPGCIVIPLYMDRLEPPARGG